MPKKARRIIKTYLPFCVLLLLAMACTMTTTTGGALMPTTAPSSPTAIPTTQPTNTPQLTPTPAPDALAISTACTVHTGQSDGFLNLRECAGMACHAVAWLPEGAQVQPIGEPGPWRLVEYGVLSGWAYSEFLECEP